MPELRPTPDRVRETLFNWLQPYITDAKCLDLFAGTGALGIEAVSRGAAGAVLLEQNRKIATRLRRTAEAFDRLTIVETDALQWLITTNQLFDIVFIDPPFSKGLMTKCFELLRESRCISASTLIYLESNRPPPAENIEIIKQTKAGQVNSALLRIRK